jgi:dolichol-phosphate mannosyltransferase
MNLRRTATIMAPAYNEARNIEGSVRDAVEAASGLEDFEIIVVDDGSNDGTAQIVDELTKEIPQLRVVHHPRNLGLGAAYRTALDHARMDYFAWTAGDRELHKESLRDILAAVGSAAVVIPYHGTPERRELHRRVLTWISTGQLNLMFGLRLHYFQGPAIYPTELARALPMTSTGFYFATERLVHALLAGHSWVQVPLRYQGRTYGRSKAVSLANVFRAEWVIWRLWWEVRVRGKLAVPRVSAPATTLLEGAE